ncbi:hypothetical protein SASPL_105963 [Salvia splendens]|uniref:Uncharacterized protein n=1 Tax=Salvia splendens TaxID=180675 RepID=A0A8X9AAG7_SALSN|nr:hypothetical protein SASPL_105963 [Salvia splendens]
MDEPKPVPQSRKRPLPHSPYYKMRQLLKDLRPHFIDVRFFLANSSFYFIDFCCRLSLSAVLFSVLAEIICLQRNVKVVRVYLDVLSYHPMRVSSLSAWPDSFVMCAILQVLKTPDFRNCQAADEIRQGMKLLMELILYQETTEKAVKLEKCSNSDNVDAKKAVKPVDNPLLDDVMSALPPETQEQRTVIIGGSAFGWNFITCHGRRAVYYGRTKEAFRALNPKSS